jgi:hypothetical protein
MQKEKKFRPRQHPLKDRDDKRVQLRIANRVTQKVVDDTIVDAQNGQDSVIENIDPHLHTEAQNVEHTVDDRHIQIAIGTDGQIASASFDDGTQDLLELADILGIELQRPEIVETIGQVLIPAADPNSPRQKKLQSKRSLCQ